MAQEVSGRFKYVNNYDDTLLLDNKNLKNILMVLVIV